jgi:adenylate cyclase
VRLDFSYQLVEGKLVRGAEERGVIRDIGYNGVLAELAGSLPRHAELKLAFDLSALGYRASDVYARIVASREQDGRYLAGMEFTSLADEAAAKVRLFVQMLLQGEYRQVD